MKNNLETILILISAFLFWSLKGAKAQNIGINGTGANAHSSALLDVDDAGTNTKGLLIPRIPLTAINAAAPVTSPATSLLVYNTASASTGTNAVSAGYYYWDGAKWVRFAFNPSGSITEAWTTTGNSGTNPTTNFLGTTDAKDLAFRTNNLEAVRITTAGNVGVGINNPAEKLSVSGKIDISSLGAGGDGIIYLGKPATKTGLAFDVINPNYGIFYTEGTPDDYVSISPNGGGDTNPVAHFRGDGNVGIGTTNPGAKLEVRDNGNRRTLHVEHDFNSLINTDAAFIGGIDAGYTATGLFVLQKDNVSFASTGTNLINVVHNSISKMLINGAGNMGIGTTSPALKLHLHDAGQNFHAMRFTAGSSQANYWDLVKRGEAYGAGQNHNFVIGYNSFERFTITPTGEVGIASSTPASRLDVLGPKPTAGGGTGVSNNAPSQAIIADGSGGGTYQNDWPAGWGGGLATWDICGQGTFFALYNTRSDRRLKKDITDMNQSIEAKFMKLRPVTYLFKKETPEINGTQYGFIAQEVAELFPTLVTKDTNVEGATIGMNYQGLIAPTVHVVQEQQKKIEQQQSQIEALLKRIEALEKK